MSIIIDPSKILAKVAPGSKIEKALKANLSLKRAALVNANQFDFLDTKAIERVAMKTVKAYKLRVEEDPEVKAEIVDDPAQLIQRVQNEVVFQVATEVKDRYAGESYRWLPSDADEPDPEHQLLYGEIFLMGEGDSEGNIPGERWGCRCGMEILVDGSSSDL